MIPMSIVDDPQLGIGVTVSTDAADTHITPATFQAFIDVIASDGLGDLQKLMSLARTACFQCGDRPSVSLDEYGAPRCETHERIAAESGWAAA